MGLAHSPKIVTDGLAFIYDTGSGKSYKGEPTANLINQMIGTTTISYPEIVYISTATETNVADSSAPGGQYSRFTGNTDSSNNQLYSRFNTASIDVRNTTITYSVYLKGSGTCHLTIYADNSGYGTSSTITLTNEWTHYTYTRSVTNYTTNCWLAVRGILTTTDVYIAAQQAEIKSHATPFVNGTRSATQGLLDLTNNATINLSNVSFDSNAQMVFDGTDDYTSLGNPTALRDLTSGTIETVYYRDASSGTYQMVFTDAGSDLEITYLGNTLQFYIGNSGLSYTHAVTDQWFNVVGTWGSEFKKLYINGVEVASGTNTGTDTGNRDRYVGGRGANFPFNGEIPIARIYGQALTDQEVLQNYNAFKSRFL